jgi:hypothetical protein
MVVTPNVKLSASLVHPQASGWMPVQPQDTLANSPWSLGNTCQGSITSERQDVLLAALPHV